MQALVNFRGDDDVCPRGPLHFSPRKRARFSSPFCRGERQRHHQELPDSLDALPDECLYEILRRLPGAREQSNSACVSKRWLTLLSSIRSSDFHPKDDDAGKSLKVPDAEDEEEEDEEEEEEEEVENMGCLTRCLVGNEVTDVRVTAVAVCTSGRGGLGKLAIRGSHPTRGLTDVGLSAVSRCCPSLKALSLWKVPHVTDSGLSELASGCPLLEMLDLRECPLITAKGLLAVFKSCPNLMSITLDSCVAVGNESFDDVGCCCPKLHFVSIKDCPLVGDQGIASLVFSASISLAKLKLYNLNISDLALACIGHYGKAITELCLIGLHNIQERGFWCMGNARGMQKLRCLLIISSHGVTDTGLETVAKGCPSIKQILVRKCCSLSDAGLKALVENAKELESLRLEECHRITLAGVLAGLVSCDTKLKMLALIKCLGIKDIESSQPVLGLFPSCKSLRTLSVRECPGFSSPSLALVGKICPNLVNLDLCGLVGITDDGLLPLSKSSEEGLTKVSLRGCVNLTDLSVCALVKEHGDTLQKLNLWGCNKLTDRVLLTISQQCTMLEELDVSKADVTDYGVALLASARHLNFRILSFSGCSRVTRMSLPLLGNMGPTLVGLNLLQCNRIPKNGVMLLMERMAWCDILS